MINNVLISDFKRPKNASYKLLEDNKNLALFNSGPFEKGMASTIGNSLRRVLLSSLDGFAVIGVKFDKVNNEYENIPGVLEDTVIICINLKKVNVSLLDSSIKNKFLTFSIKGKKVFTAKDIEDADPQVKVGNPDLVIFNTNKTADFEFSIQISYGRGYVPSENFIDNIEAKGTIVLDADFSPVKRCAFSVGDMKLGTKNGFEKLEIEIETKNTISPEDALKRSAQILKESFLTFNETEEDSLTTAINSNDSTARSERDKIYYQTVHDLPLLVKSHYFLKVNGIHEIGQLVTKSEVFLKSKKKVDAEIISNIVESLKQNSLSLDMKSINYLENS